MVSKFCSLGTIQTVIIKIKKGLYSSNFKGKRSLENISQTLPKGSETCEHT